ncbi:hypothetical protein lerEdw1_012611 [Lerista edwardsae]|nr:hypothetical protein lerEdw1_012611 [Lerista edwardsae]
MNLQGVTREFSLYLESQVREGLLASGVAWSLVLCFGAAYAWYYLSSIAKMLIYIGFYSEHIKAADGGQISLDWFDNKDSIHYPDSSIRPTILLLPGLTGTSRESYILHMIEQSKTLGYRCVVFNYRGSAGENLLTPRTYCASDTEDLETVIYHIHNLYSSALFMAAGVSMGGNRQMFDNLCNMNLVMKAKTIREFDKQFTSVMFGYPTIDDYYADASPCRRLKRIGIPVHTSGNRKTKPQCRFGSYL